MLHLPTDTNRLVGPRVDASKAMFHGQAYSAYSSPQTFCRLLPIIRNALTGKTKYSTKLGLL